MPRRLATGVIRAYQRFVSPLLGSHCRFLPSCSEYAVMAIDEWGVLKGGALAAWRIARCHPLTAGGLDLPPRRMTSKAANRPASGRYSG
ncbi:MAG: membrane protein insertion efficiency factor YidD [Acidobacteriota bacterium]|nr:membrane protein insertion efficiency factor YidD [Acidobacteriota bacterium]MDQ7087473.1 membrane protein insertion efficiency factor YidD [Acidobacteriota bacterium]